jgi:hypothetical protein
MATREQLRALITRIPFQPFVIRMTGGRVFTIRHPENAACAPDSRALVVMDDEGIHFAEMLLVEVMEAVSAGQAGSGGNGTQ